MSFQVVNGYVCFNCSDVALAKKGDNPAHPPGTPSNPTGQTPNGPNAAGATSPGAGLIQTNAASATSNGPAVVFGGSLAQPVGSASAPATVGAPPQPTYQSGARLNVSA